MCSNTERGFSITYSLNFDTINQEKRILIEDMAD